MSVFQNGPLGDLPGTFCIWDVIKKNLPAESVHTGPTVPGCDHKARLHIINHHNSLKIPNYTNTHQETNRSYKPTKQDIPSPLCKNCKDSLSRHNDLAEETALHDSFSPSLTCDNCCVDGKDMKTLTQETSGQLDLDNWLDLEILKRYPLQTKFPIQIRQITETPQRQVDDWFTHRALLSAKLLPTHTNRI